MRFWSLYVKKHNTNYRLLSIIIITAEESDKMDNFCVRGLVLRRHALQTKHGKS